MIGVVMTTHNHSTPDFISIRKYQYGVAMPSITDTWERLVRFHRTTTKAMDQHLRITFGHSLDDYDVLHQISVHDGPVRMGDLAEHLLVANSSCHRIVGRLVDQGLVERRRGAGDRRVIAVQLTARGQRLRRRMALAHARDIDALFGSRLGGEDHRRLDDLLRLLADTEPTTPSD